MESKEYVIKVGKTIVNQLYASTSKFVIGSWGTHDFQITEFQGMVSLQFKVNGFLHKGEVVIAYNRGNDLYEIYTLKKGAIVSHVGEVYCDQLGSVVDSLVERSAEWTDKEYNDIIDKEYGIK